MNTVVRVDQELLDVLQTDEDVLAWLKQAGFPVSGEEIKPESVSLVDSARRLREAIRALIEKRKAGQAGDPSVLNRFLAASRSYRRLHWSKARSPKIETVWQQDTSASILAPLAQAAADLLVTADFRFVKRCEDNNCVLWFSDQTKSHRRRWCSMELCGNRHKVAAYRKRRRGKQLSSR